MPRSPFRDEIHAVLKEINIILANQGREIAILRANLHSLKEIFLEYADDPNLKGSSRSSRT